MSIVLQELQPHHWDWIQKRERINWTSDTCGIVAVDDKTNKIAGAWILYDMSPNSTYSHIIIENPMALRRKHLEAVANYIFNIKGIKILLGHVPSKNVKALKIDKHLGFVEHSSVKDGISDGVDEIKIILKKEDCRYLNKSEELKEAS